MSGDPMRVYLIHCGYRRMDFSEAEGYELWSNGIEFVRLVIDGQDRARYAVLEDRFEAELNLEDLLALLEFPVKKVA